jgi:glutamyl-tRNA reductase
MFRVGTGLDSQFLGDWIISQNKMSFAQSKDLNACALWKVG